MVFIVIILTFFFLPSFTYALDFTPYAVNPVIVKDVSSLSILQPFVLKKGSLFTAWFSDYDGIRLKISTMKSSNGIDWYSKKTLQLSNTYNVGDPFMWEKNGKYELYYSSLRSTANSIWKSISDDGETFIQASEKEILKPEQSWERYGVSCPSIIQDSSSMHYLFYSGASSSAWSLGLATSIDGETWQKCSNNPFVPEGSSPQIIKYNNVYYLFFHSLIGLQVQQTDVLNGCSTVWTNNHIISAPFLDPAPVVVDNDLWLYGSFTSQGSQNIGLAATAQIANPSYPIVIIPGMFASWNPQALLHNKAVSYDSWKLNTNISEYDALIKTLQNTGKVLDKDFYIFPYDWRSPIEESSYYLDSFLRDKIWKYNAYIPVQLVGHSLGGVVARIYTEENPSSPVKQMISAASPHLGAVQAYKPLVAGEVDRENSLMWMATKLALLLFKSELQSDKDTVSEKLPVLFDLLPAFSFLKKEDGSLIQSSYVSNLISRYPLSHSPFQFYIGGSGKPTSGGYVLGSKTPLDELLDIYSEGHPISSWTETGDGLILDKSMVNQITPVPSDNHGEIIYSKQSIKTILSHLNISVEDSAIAEGKGTSIYPAILTFIQSPATMQLVHNGTTTYENEGMIHLQNAENGEYILRITGTKEGEYTASVWLIGENNDVWIQFKKQTTSGKIDDYIISFEGTTGGTALEYKAPTPTVAQSLAVTPTLLTTLQATPTPLTLSQSTTSSNSTTTPSNSSNSTTPIYSTSGNGDVDCYSKKSPLLVRSIPKQSISPITQTIDVPQVLGKSDNNKKVNRFPFAELLFIQQVLWGVCAGLIIIFNKAKKLISTIKGSY